MSNDRYERIRAALAMGPTPGPRRAVEQSVIGPQDLSILFAKVTFSVGINGSHSIPIEEAIANAALAAACDPDTIRELLAERDQLAAALAAPKYECDRCGCEVDASDELSDGSYRCDECFTFFAELNWYDPDDREERIEDYLKMKGGEP